MIEQARPSRTDLLLDDLRDACHVARDIVRRGRTNYDRDEVTRFAAQMVIVRLGAVARRLGADAPVAIPDFDWTGLTGTRNKIVHEYPTIDYEIVWNALEHEVTELAAALDRIRYQQPDDGAVPPPEGRR